MARRAPALPTFEELYAEIQRLPEGLTGEILDPGVLRTMSRPARPHWRAAKQCMRALSPFDVDSGGKGWWIAGEPEVRFGPRLFVPDLAGWRAERVAEMPAENPITLTPDWCCEVLSPRTARDDRTVKLPLDARSGVGWIWLVDPELQVVEVYEALNDRPVFATSAAEAETAALPPFDGEIALGAWWSAPAETA